MPFISEVEQIFIQRFYTGWITLRNQLTTPIRLMGRRVIELYDALIAGNDWEVTPLLSLKRRAGHTAYATINFPAQLLYSWKSNTMGTIPIIDTTGDIEYVSSVGGVTAITTKLGAMQSSILGIGNYLYVGNANLQFKWDGPTGSQGKTNWGIAIGSVNNSALETTTSGTDGGGSVPWTNPGNATSAVSYATVTINPTSVSPGASDQLLTTTYGFSLPAGDQILGIQVQFDALSTVGGKSQVNARLLRNGTATGNIEATPSLTTSNANYTLGGTSDLWGSTFTANDVDQTGFGVELQAYTSPLSIHGGGAACTVSVRHVQITVFFLGGPSAVPTGSGSFTAVNGYTYVFAYGNSVSGEISNATLPSINTGPFTNKQYVAVGLTASLDPQVNQIRVYRTTDSGGGNQFFEISTSPYPNTTATIQDTTVDTNLQVTSQAEINLGNTPPPATLVNLEWFAGRMWGSTNNLLWASTGPETISGTAPNSNWNPEFQYVIPGFIMRNVRGPSGMLIFTQDDCYIVRGTDITNYTVNEFVKDFGIRTYNAVDTDGTNLYVFTSDRQFIQMSSSGAGDIGLPIADQLFNVDPNFVYVKVNRYGLDSIVRVLDTINNIYYDFNVNQQCWNLPGILQMPACTAMGSIETIPGVWRLLLSSNNSGTVQLAYRDINNFLDLGTAYSPKAVFGSLQLADPGNLAKFGGRGGMCMEYTSAGSAPTLSVLFNDVGATLSNAVGSQITGTFTGFQATYPINGIPTLADGPANYRSLYYYMTGLSTRISGYLRHMQFQLVAPAENKATELLGWGIFGDQKQESESAGQVPQLQGK